jgi:hypothetical protein
VGRIGEVKPLGREDRQSVGERFGAALWFGLVAPAATIALMFTPFYTVGARDVDGSITASLSEVDSRAVPLAVAVSFSLVLLALQSLRRGPDRCSVPIVGYVGASALLLLLVWRRAVTAPEELTTLLALTDPAALVRTEPGWWTVGVLSVVHVAGAAAMLFAAVGAVLWLRDRTRQAA